MITYITVVAFEDRPNILRLTEMRIRAMDATQAKVKARKEFRQRFPAFHIDHIEAVALQ